MTFKKKRKAKKETHREETYGDVTIKSITQDRKETAVVHEPHFLMVKFGLIDMWGDNPRVITPEKLELLARSMKKYGIFKTLTCWPGPKGRYVTGGGNMRYRAMKEILGYTDDTDIIICLVTPRSYAEKIELSLLDNQSFGFYDTLEVADLIKPFAAELDMEMLTVQTTSPLDLAEVIEDIDEAEDAAPLIPDAKFRDDGKTYVPIGGDLAIVGFGNYCGVVDRTMIDKMAALLADRFGNNRAQRILAGEWVAKYLMSVLTPLVGPPTPAEHLQSEKFTEEWEKIKDSRKEEKIKEYEAWKKKALAKSTETIS